MWIAAASLALCAGAQTPSEPPQLLRVIRSAATRLNARPYADARAPVTVLAMAPLSGPSETWLIELHDSFASIEAVDKALAGSSSDAGAPTGLTSDDVLTPSRALIALYRPGWSYLPEDAMRLLPKSHYLQVSIFRNRSGEDAAFSELVRSRKASLESINLDRPDMAYEVISGAPSGTYFLVAPLTSLRVLDDGLAARIAHVDRVTDAGTKRPPIPDISREHLLFRIDPRASRVPDDFVSTDPGFWTGKPAADQR